MARQWLSGAVMLALAGSVSAQGYYDDSYYADEEPAYAEASYRDDYRGDRRGAGDGYDFARVVDARPVYENVPVSEPRRQCWEEPVTYVSGPRHRHRSGTPEIVGGIIGGIVGNQFGRGDGRTAATVAGVLLGASMGRDAERNRHYGPRYERTVSERRCDIVESYREERQLTGYDVTYDYNGTIGQVFTDRHPGTEIRVRVMVEPADY
jgi:uncharacterized protein YcfJ